MAPTKNIPAQPATAPGPIQCEFSGKGFTVSEVSQRVELEVLRDELAELANEAVERNFFYEPTALLPALSSLNTHDQMRVLLVREVSKKTDQISPLVGLIPVVETRGWLGLRQWTLWKHPYCYFTAPLIRHGSERETLNTFFDYVQQQAPSPAFVRFPALPGDGPIHHALLEIQRERLQTTFVHDEYLRAALQTPEDGERYLKDIFSGHHLREYRRMRRKLEELGQVEYRQCASEAQASIWIDWFLDLEASGWKAGDETAIQFNESHTAYFEETVRTAASRGQLLFDGLFLDGEPIAMCCGLVSDSTKFAFKIAFDESLRKYSPGIQLELERIRSHQHGEITFSDSCAVPDHPMINRIWKDRRIIRDISISTGHRRGELMLGALPLLRSFRRLLKSHR